MHSASKINSLRIEKHLIQNRLATIEKNLNTGTFNTRKYQTDTEKIRKLKNRLTEIATEIQLESKKLNKLQSIQTFTDIPILNNMFRTPPKKNSPDMENPLNKTFETLVSQENTSTSTAEMAVSVDVAGIGRKGEPKTQYPYIEDIIETDKTILPPSRKSGDFDDFVQRSVGLGMGGGATRKIPKKYDSITSEQLTGVLPIPTFTNVKPFQTTNTQVYKNPVISEISKKPATFADDSYALRPPISQTILFKDPNLNNFSQERESPKSKLPPFERNIFSEKTHPKIIRQNIQNPSRGEKLGHTGTMDLQIANKTNNYPQVWDNNTQRNVQNEREYVENQNQYSYNPIEQNIAPQNTPPEPQNLPNLRDQNPRNGQNFAHIQNNKPRKTFLRRLNSIPKFSGESYSQLKEFIGIIESLYISCINENEQQELYEQMVLQLRGESRNTIMGLENPDWGTIKGKLLKDFGYLANKEILTTQLENVRQYKDESLNTYAERVRHLLRDKNATYSYMTEEQKMEHNRLARRSFSRGLSDNKLRNRLLMRGASSLEDAIAYAIEAENDDITYIPNFDLFCRKCNTSGHRQKDCNRQNNDNSDMGRLISALRAVGGQTRPPNQNRNPFTNNFNRNSNFRDRNWNFDPNSENRNSNSDSQNRGWNFTNLENRNSNSDSQNRNWNQNTQNRDWHQNANMQNNNRNMNFDSQNRNWNQNTNSFMNRNNANFGNRNTNRNAMGNSSRTNNRPPNNDQNRMSQEEFNPRLNERMRQENTINMANTNNSGDNISSSSSSTEN